MSFFYQGQLVESVALKINYSLLTQDYPTGTINVRTLTLEVLEVLQEPLNTPVTLVTVVGFELTICPDQENMFHLMSK